MISCALKEKLPVGIAISKDREILSIRHSDNDIVESIIPEGEKTFKVWFMGHDGIFSLDRSHPGFDKIYSTLERSRRDSERVWFIAELSRLRILDALTIEKE